MHLEFQHAKFPKEEIYRRVAAGACHSPPKDVCPPIQRAMPNNLKIGRNHPAKEESPFLPKRLPKRFALAGHTENRVISTSKGNKTI